jgi:hypothetical protein
LGFWLVEVLFMGRERGEAVNDEGLAVVLTVALALASISSPTSERSSTQHPIYTTYLDHQQSYHLMTDLITFSSTYKLSTLYHSLFNNIYKEQT